MSQRQLAFVRPCVRAESVVSGCSFVQDGKVSHLDHMFIRGSRVRFIIVPEMLKNAPMFKRIDPKHRVSVMSHFLSPNGIAVCRGRILRWAWVVGVELLRLVPRSKRRVDERPARRHVGRMM